MSTRDKQPVHRIVSPETSKEATAAFVRVIHAASTTVIEAPDGLVAVHVTLLWRSGDVEYHVLVSTVAMPALAMALRDAILRLGEFDPDLDPKNSN